MNAIIKLLAYANENNLVYQSYKAVFDYLKLPLRNVHIQIDANIPVSRGLGSSSTCIIGGVMGANALLNYPLNADEIFQLCTKIEGHPDNVAPALFGGLTASMMQDEKAYTINYDIADDFKFLACIPDFELSTAMARSALPKTIAFTDAVFNISRAAISLKCWETKNYELLRLSLTDVLHQPYRGKLINEYDSIITLINQSGAEANFISGAGPTIMTIYEDDSYIERLSKNISTLQNNWRLLPLQIEMKGALQRNGVNTNGR